MNVDKLMMDTASWLAKQGWALEYNAVGSALYVAAPKDVDFVVLVQGETVEPVLVEHLDDWAPCGDAYDDQTFKWSAVRKEEVNLIVTVDEKWFERMVVASKVCEALKLQDKADRIVVHRVVRDGYEPDEANARRDGRL